MAATSGDPDNDLPPHSELVDLLKTLLHKYAPLFSRDNTLLAILVTSFAVGIFVLFLFGVDISHILNWLSGAGAC